MPAPRAPARARRRGGGRGGRGGRGGSDRRGTTLRPPPPPTGPRNCHDVTAYPAMHLLAGACASYGSARRHLESGEAGAARRAAPTRTSRSGTRPCSATTARRSCSPTSGAAARRPMCQATSMMEMGGNTILTISADKKYTQHAYFKIPTAQTAQENCVSHNGGLIPVPGRDLMVQGWYQGGVDVMRLHRSRPSVRDRVLRSRPGRSAPAELPARHRRRSDRSRRRVDTIGGSWGAYYWNGYIYSSELDARLRHPRAACRATSSRRTRSRRRSW